MNRLLTRLILALGATTLSTVSHAAEPKLEVVAEWTRLHYDLGDAAAEKAYDDKQIWKKVLMQGVKVDSRGNIYVSTARWGGKEVPATLSKLVKVGHEWKLQPFPSKEMNDVANPKGLKAVLGFEIDRNDVMWILDQGHIAGAPSGPGDEKLIGWDLKTGKEVARYEFTEADSDRKCSFLNDLAVDNDAGVIYISDSGIFCDPLKGGLIVYNMRTNQAKRVLSAPEWVNDEKFTFQIHGRPVLKNGPMRTGADGIALSGDKKTLYWTNLTGNRLLALPTPLMRDFSKSEDEIKKAVKVVATLPSNTDGMTADRDNNLYMTALTLNGVMKRDAKSGAVSLLVSSDEISWPDTLAWGPGGTLYLVSNHLHLWVDGDMDFDKPKVPNFRIYRMKLGAKPYHAK
ncbi:MULTISPECIES: L-dopachrome tautomerase-related protein [Caldimonas]|uniref:L-dopachrome tautomerase-related protein n=1 Tax=Caldimonas TaxID=196013 RepID=UPI0003696797|nr:L-dopachrome tautomerase-related protein [Caldimonas manganoxidans]MCX7660772.1 major royal jelly family protein [Caldimonas manganoxidans]